MPKPPEKLFIDTDAFYALKNENDPLHKGIVSASKSIAAGGSNLYTGTQVVIEILNLLTTRGFKKYAMELGKELIEGQSIQIIPASYYLGQALTKFQKQRVKKVSFTDCLSFVQMEDYQISVVLGQDKHFEKNGFECYP